MKKRVSEIKGGWGIVPRVVMRAEDLSFEAKCIYAYLCSFAGDKDIAYPSRETILKDLKISKTRFYKYLNELVEKGYVEVLQNRSSEGVFSKNNYRLVSPSPNFEDTDREPSPNFKDTDKIGIKTASKPAITEGSASDDEVSPCPNFKDTNNNNINNNNIYISIFEKWNFEKITNHRKLTQEMKTKIKKALKDYTLKEIESAIVNYSHIVNSSEYYFNHKWSLGDFLHRGLEKFIDIDVAKHNYRDNLKQSREQIPLATANHRAVESYWGGIPE